MGVSKLINWFLANLQIYVCEFVNIYIHSPTHSLICFLKGSSMEVTTTNDGGKQYNDGKWHEIIAVRHQAFGQITLDGQYTGKSYIYERFY